MLQGSRETVKDFDIFLEKSEYGFNRVYQLHRELGGVFIDASFQDEERPALVFTTQIILEPPKYVDSELRWDEYGFMYELENYRLVNDSTVRVPLYRSFGPALAEFIIDVVDHILNEPEWAPKEIQSACQQLIDHIEDIRVFLSEKHKKLSDNERQAIDIFLGEAGIWDYLDNNVYDAVGQLLYRKWEKHLEEYEAVAKEANDTRRQVLANAEAGLIYQYETKLQEHNFNKGFVSS